MERKDKACWNCLRYKAYYTKGLCHFDKEKFGFCTKHERMVDKQEGCPFWSLNNPRRETRKKVAMRKLSEILTQLVEIRQILFESKEENEKEENGS